MNERKTTAFLTPEGLHKLQTKWSFWYEKKNKNKSTASNTWENSLKMLGSFETVEDFWRHYIHIKRPSQLDVLHNLYLFREDLKPMWETFPDEGCWILKVKKSSGVTSKLWQDLVFACVGELFEEPTVAGIVLAVRAKDDIISIWNSSNSKNVEMRFLIAEKLKKILNLDMNTIIEYKSHRESISDGSSFRNAEAYVLTDDK